MMQEGHHVVLTESCAFSADVLLGRPLEMFCQATTEINFVTVVSILFYINVRFSR